MQSQHSKLLVVINLNKTTLKQLNTLVEEVGLRVVELCFRLGVLINCWV